MTIPDHVVQARREARSAAARIVFHPSHLLDEREGGCSACEAQGSALARVCAAILRNEAPRRCPACSIPLTVLGSVFCQSGDYDQSRGAYAAEGAADVYGCKNGHSFAWNPPYKDQPDDDLFCRVCRMNVGTGASHNEAACQAEYEA